MLVPSEGLEPPKPDPKSGVISISPRGRFPVVSDLASFFQDMVKDDSAGGSNVVRVA